MDEEHQAYMKKLIAGGQLTDDQKQYAQWFIDSDLAVEGLFTGDPAKDKAVREGQKKSQWEHYADAKFNWDKLAQLGIKVKSLDFIMDDRAGIITTGALKSFKSSVKDALGQDKERVYMFFSAGPKPAVGGKDPANANRFVVFMTSQKENPFKNLPFGLAKPNALGFSTPGGFAADIFQETIEAQIKLSGGNRDIMVANVLLHELIWHGITGHTDLNNPVPTGKLDITQPFMPFEQHKAAGVIPKPIAEELKKALELK